MKNKKFKAILICAVIIMGIVGGKTIYQSTREKKALDLVQNGYMGTYNMVTTKEVMEDYPRDKGTQKWEVKVEKINDEKRLIVNYSFNDKICITFLPDKKGESYKVFSIRGDDGEMVESSEFSSVINSMYQNYMQKYPEKGVNAIKDRGDLDLGNKGEIKKAQNGELYNEDMADYIDTLCFISTTEKLNLEEVKTEDIFGDKVAYESEKGNLYISLEDTNIFDGDDNVATIQMVIEGSSNMAPAFNGIRMGDNSGDVKNKLESKGFQFKNDKEIDRRVNEVEYQSNEGEKVVLNYRNSTGKIYYLLYTKEIMVSELKAYGYEHAEFIK